MNHLIFTRTRFVILFLALVQESGDSLEKILDDEALLMCNHQSTADIGIIMQSLHPKGMAAGHMTWIMDHVFKLTHFGWICGQHGDFFLKQPCKVLCFDEFAFHIYRICLLMLISLHLNHITCKYFIRRNRKDKNRLKTSEHIYKKCIQKHRRNGWSYFQREGFFPAGNPEVRGKEENGFLKHHLSFF